MSHHGGNYGINPSDVAARWRNLHDSAHPFWHKGKNRKILNAFLVACNGAFNGRVVGVGSLYDTQEEAQKAIDRIKEAFDKLSKTMTP